MLFVCFFLDFKDSKAVDSADGLEAAIAVGIPRQRSTELTTRDCGGGCGAHLQLTATTPGPPEPRLRVGSTNREKALARHHAAAALAYERQTGTPCRPAS